MCVELVRYQRADEAPVDGFAATLGRNDVKQAAHQPVPHRRMAYHHVPGDTPPRSAGARAAPQARTHAPERV
jgi:hypothetical protein